MRAFSARPRTAFARHARRARSRAPRLAAPSPRAAVRRRWRGGGRALISARAVARAFAACGRVACFPRSPRCVCSRSRRRAAAVKEACTGRRATRARRSVRAGARPRRMAAAARRGRDVGELGRPAACHGAAAGRPWTLAFGRPRGATSAKRGRSCARAARRASASTTAGGASAASQRARAVAALASAMGLRVPRALPTCWRRGGGSPAPHHRWRLQRSCGYGYGYGQSRMRPGPRRPRASSWRRRRRCDPQPPHLVVLEWLAARRRRRSPRGRPSSSTSVNGRELGRRKIASNGVTVVTSETPCSSRRSANAAASIVLHGWPCALTAGGRRAAARASSRAARCRASCGQPARRPVDQRLREREEAPVLPRSSLTSAAMRNSLR